MALHDAEQETIGTVLRVGYVVRRFPRLSQSFVLNEVAAVLRAGHKVQVFSLVEASDEDRAMVQAANKIPVLGASRVGLDGFARDLLHALWRNPRRLIRTLKLVSSRHDSELWEALWQALRISRVAERLGLDHLHAHLRFGSDCLWLVGQMTGRRWTFTAHALDIHVNNRYLTEKLAEAAQVVTVCDFNKAVLRSRMGTAGEDKIHIIRPFLAPELIDAVLQPPLATKHDELRIACVCRLVPKKGVDVLIQAVALLRDRALKVRLTLVGDGPERQRLGTDIANAGLGARVWLAGPANAAGVRELLVMSDCFVLASRSAPDGDSDATPTVLGEAMAMGLPVVSTRFAGIPEIVPEGAGLLVPPGDAAALADAIAEIASMPAARRRAMGECGRRFVREHWNGDKDVHRLLAIFQTAMARHAPVS